MGVHPVTERRRPAVFFDRDGVLNEAVVVEGKPYPPYREADVHIFSEAPPALARLKAAGYALICVTNQPDVARGTQTHEAVGAINARLLAELPLDDILVCFHDDPDGCDCRKPAPGLLLQAVARHGIDLTASFMVGDRWRDTLAGHRAGCRTVLIDHGYNESWSGPPPDKTTTTLADAVAWILKETSVKTSEEILTSLKVKMFADGADRAGMLEMYRNPWIKGFTTNPTLMRKAGIADYEKFAREILEVIPDRPISFEVFSDQFSEMKRQALRIAKWGGNVYVKIPVTNTRGEPAEPLVRELAGEGVKLNVTALLTLDQVRDVSAALAGGAASYVSVFAGRIADTGRDPVPLMAAAVELVNQYKNQELIWASPRELLNIFQADAVGCHIITATNDVLKKLSLVGKDLRKYSLETVSMFWRDAAEAGFTL
jgi:transaldolase